MKVSECLEDSSSEGNYLNGFDDQRRCLDQSSDYEECKEINNKEKK